MGRATAFGFYAHLGVSEKVDEPNTALLVGPRELPLVGQALKGVVFDAAFERKRGPIRAERKGRRKEKGSINQALPPTAVQGSESST